MLKIVVLNILVQTWSFPLVKTLLMALLSNVMHPLISLKKFSLKNRSDPNILKSRLQITLQD